MSPINIHICVAFKLARHFSYREGLSKLDPPPTGSETVPSILPIQCFAASLPPPSLHMRIASPCTRGREQRVSEHEQSAFLFPLGQGSRGQEEPRIFKRRVVVSGP